MKKIVDKIARELNTALKKTLDGFEGLYVFGSQVRGEATKDSDIDIVVIMNDPDNFDKRDIIWGIVSLLEYNYDIFLDIHPKTREQLEMNYSFHDEVVNKGVFYAAAA
ncbi:MAG: nucleotidyltransferase domain-containing protein [Heliobacteriaceae bacterium]|jgi:predicted nucleotidyltransferase|nr:nucleotidyltransferase domain-containing protein [Heliobacteriaceae bacterium]